MLITAEKLRYKHFFDHGISHSENYLFICICLNVLIFVIKVNFA